MSRNSTFLSAVLCLFLLTAMQNVSAQCPEGSNVTSNGFCFYAVWETPPPQENFPSTVFSGGSIFTYEGGTGTVGDPAVYQSGGGGGACNAEQSGFTGEIVVGDDVCSFTNGTLDPEVALPVVLMSFNVNVVNDGVLVEWATATEVNNEYFTVERTSDLENWELVEQVDGTNLESGIAHYSITDMSFDPGPNYYRLSQTDLDGELTYLGVRVVPTGSVDNDELRVFPNPATDIINLSPTSLNVSRIELIDSNGRIVSESNSAQNFIKLPDVPAGLYLVRITEVSGSVSTRKVIIQ